MRDKELVVGDRAIGGGGPVFVIVDVGLGHGGSLPQICRLIDLAAQAGVDGVRIHAHRVDRLVASDTVRAGSPDQVAIQRMRNAELSAEGLCRLKQHAESRGICYLPTPTDEETVDSLDQLGVHGYRVASCDLTHIPLLRHIASKGRPVFLSTGMSYLSEVADAVWALRSAGAAEIVLMHCVSSPPAPAEALNLRAIQTLRDHFELPVGYSDHSEGVLFPLVAATLGAVVVEKTLTLDKSTADPAHVTAMEPGEMVAMVQDLRALELSLGDGRKRPAFCEEGNRVHLRRSVVAACDIRAYESVTQWMLACKRPGSGIEPGRMERLIGMQARKNISKDSILRWDDLAASAGREPKDLAGLLDGVLSTDDSPRTALEGSAHGTADLQAAGIHPQGGRRRL
jgi:N,N'-diacetyllegionaminate synthase